MKKPQPVTPPSALLPRQRPMVPAAHPIAQARMPFKPAPQVRAVLPSSNIAVPIGNSSLLAGRAIQRAGWGGTSLLAELARGRANAQAVVENEAKEEKKVQQEAWIEAPATGQQRQRLAHAQQLADARAAAQAVVLAIASARTRAIRNPNANQRRHRDNAIAHGFILASDIIISITPYQCLNHGDTRPADVGLVSTTVTLVSADGVERVVHLHSEGTIHSRTVPNR